MNNHEKDIEEKGQQYADSVHNRETEAVKWANANSGYQAGWKACEEQESWKNLYAEGLKVGMKMLRDYEGQLKEKADKWNELIEKLKAVRNNYTDREWSDKHVKDEIDRDIVWTVSLLTKYEVNW